MEITSASKELCSISPCQFLFCSPIGGSKPGHPFRLCSKISLYIPSLNVHYKFAPHKPKLCIFTCKYCGWKLGHFIRISIFKLVTGQTNHTYELTGCHEHCPSRKNNNRKMLKTLFKTIFHFLEA